MRKRQELGLSSTMLLAVGLIVMSTVLAGGALHGYGLYRHQFEAQDLRLRVMAETYAAQLGRVIAVGEAAAIRDQLDSFTLHPDTVLIAVFDRDGALTARRGSKDLFVQCHREMARARISGQIKTWRIDSNAEVGIPEIGVMTMPVSLGQPLETAGTLMIATRIVGTPGIASAEVWRYFGYSILIAAAGISLGVLWLRERVLRPLAQLSRRSSNHEEVAGLVSRGDEIGQLARVMTEMQRNADDWREKANDLQRSLDHKVTARTSEITRKLRVAKREVWRDPLTRLGNRRLLEDKLEEIFLAQSQAGQDLSIVMLDVDNFKALNDVMGHKAGDDLLVFLGKLLGHGIRDQDIAIRLGGDEFLLVLPSVPAKDAARVVDRMVKLFAQQANMHKIEPRVTLSAGVASLHQHQPASADELIKLADEALYDSKRGGKSQVQIRAIAEPLGV